MEKKQKLKKAVRAIIVTRRTIENMWKVPYLRDYANQMAVSLIEYAKRNKLDYALITRKF